MRFIEKLAAIVAGCLLVFFVGLAVLYFSGSTGRGTGPLSWVTGLWSPNCDAELVEYRRSTLAPLLDEWIDALDLAVNTPRLAMAPQIASLQAMRRELDAIEPSSCAKETHQKFVTAADEMIKGLLGYLGQQSQYEAEQHFETAAALIIELRFAVAGKTVEPSEANGILNGIIADQD